MAPLSLQEGYDNSGLACGDPEKEIDRCLVCLDVTTEVVEEARSQSIPLIISHHPVIFSGIKKIVPGNMVEDIIIQSIRHDIALYSMHTNLDNIRKGVNDILCRKLGLENLKVLKPVKGQLNKLVVFCPVSHVEKVRAAIFEAGAGVIGNYDCCSFNIEGKGSFRANEKADPFVGKANEVHFEDEVRIETILPFYIQGKVLDAMIEAHPYEEVAYDIYPLLNQNPYAGAGMLGEFDTGMTELDFMDHLKKALSVAMVKHSPLTGKKIRKVAVCGGSGNFLLDDAIKSGADAFVTAEIKYHQYFSALNRILLIDAGHYETEQFTTELIAEYFKEIFPNFAVHISKMARNPVNYL
jgi:dinuclear metal center YbgI/SA1388 family protein